MFGANVKSLATVLPFFYARRFDDSHFFQRLTLIDICCGPPAR
jgi:hypothetical protein